MTVYRFEAGSTPLLISMPHTGQAIPEDIAARMHPWARAVPDTDWYMDRLYDFATEVGASVLAARQSRYVIDLNRPPDGTVLYPGASNTELCPTTTFDLRPLYLDGQAPDTDEIEERIGTWWQPYHTRIATTLQELRERHGYALLLDAHSIASRVPRFFEGRLTDLNLGTADGRSCDPALRQAASAALSGCGGYTLAVDGRFKGGYITRRYGNPGEHVHALQLEQSQATYCREREPGDYDPELAARVRPCLRALVRAMLDWGRSRHGH